MANNWEATQYFKTTSNTFGQGEGMNPATNYPPPYPYPQPNYQIQPMPIAVQPQPCVPIHQSNPGNTTNCPSGLEYLASIDQILVKQKVELLEVVTGFETNNEYIIQNIMGQNIYTAIEDNDCCTRNCCGSMRPFDMKVLDMYQREILRFYRPLACSCCCFPCCLQTIDVKLANGQFIGKIQQEWTICYPQYAVKNHNGETVLRIEGPLCTFSCGGDVEFKILSLNGNQVGKISKQWSGLVKEMYTDADNFGISFPMDLDVRMKAVMLSACILIDMMFFERANDNN